MPLPYVYTPYLVLITIYYVMFPRNSGKALMGNKGTTGTNQSVPAAACRIFSAARASPTGGNTAVQLVYRR